ncbi:MAG: hypothetical protein Q8T11_16065 [Elusimicrobiota bacterium]|nr:hypothetical protein [Elusimicrobiota bacterium]
MRALALAVILAVPASAQEEEAGLAAQQAREQIEALPVEARVELKKMFRRYRDAVARKLEGGWRPRVLSEAVIEDVDEPFQPARLVEGMIDLRKKEIAELQESLNARKEGDYRMEKRLNAALAAKREALDTLISMNRREKGLCRDWSDLIWSEFTAMELEHWGARDERRATRPYHTAAVACSPAESPTVCLAFDPWEDGRPNVYAYRSWDESTPGGRFPAVYLIHGLPDRVGKAP